MFIKWSNTGLESINETINNEMIGHRMHDRRLAIERMDLPYLKGGRDVLDAR